jgi:hypothetical protein
MQRLMIILVVVVLGIASTANAESLSVLGRNIQLVPPPGFCTLGNSAVELELARFQRQNTSPAGELVQFAVPCSELSNFKSGKSENFTRWVQILVLKHKGALKTVTTPRVDFVRDIAGRLADSPPDMNALSARMRDHLAKSGSSVSGASAQPIGATSEAVFMELRMTVTHGTDTSPVVAVMAVTVVNQLPVAVYAYATPKSRGESPVDTSRAYLRKVIDLN